MVEWKRWSPLFPCCPVSCQCPWKETLIEKKKRRRRLDTDLFYIIESSEDFRLKENYLPDHFLGKRISSQLNLRENCSTSFLNSVLLGKEIDVNFKPLQRTLIWYWHNTLPDKSNSFGLVIVSFFFLLLVISWSCCLFFKFSF